jgi:hypothetical protein
MSATVLAFPTPASRDGGKARLLCDPNGKPYGDDSLGFGQISKEVFDSLNFMPASAAIAIATQERNQARIASHRNGQNRKRDDLTMRHADPEDTAPSEYSAPTFDGA